MPAVTTDDLEKSSTASSSRRGSISGLLKSRRRSSQTLLLVTVASLIWMTRSLLGLRLSPTAQLQLPGHHLFGNDYASLAARADDIDARGILTLHFRTLLDSCDNVRGFARDLPEISWFHVEELSANEVLHPWTDDWISKNELPANLSLTAPRFDLVYTWTNGSTEDFQAEKRPHDKLFAFKHKLKYAEWQATQVSRYRSFDELRYSIRSAVKYASSWVSRIVILSKTLEKQDGSGRYTQHPDWLNLHALDAELPVEVIPELEIFAHKQCAPTYNSVSIESQLSHLNITEGTTHLVALSDDMFFGGPVSASDFYSQLFGMSMAEYGNYYAFDEHTEPYLDVNSGGELLHTRYTSYWLSKRFGHRARPLQLHHPKVISKAISNEAMLTFPQTAVLTPLSQHRYDQHQLYGWYLHNQFTIEMHREAMLWSAVLRMDINEDGILDTRELNNTLHEIETGKAQQLRTSEWTKQTAALQSMHGALYNADLPPLSVQTGEWSSMDGPVHMRDIWPAICEPQYTHAQCLGFDSETQASMTILDVYDFIRKAPVGCGDCFLQYLLDNAERGLEPVLPRKRPSGETTPYRQTALRGLQKYAYTVAMPSSQFHTVESVSDADNLLNSPMAGFVCVNDDLVTRDPEVVDAVYNSYAAFYQRHFPAKLALEKYPPEAASVAN